VHENASDSRQRMVAGTADMLRRRGLNATSVRELAQHAQAPLGSMYHYFPGGKSELAAEAVRWADDITARTLRKELRAGPVAGVEAFLTMWRKIVLDSHFQAGCPVLAVAVEDHPEQEEAPRLAAASAFRNWTAILAESLRDHGATDSDANRIATLIVAAVEGTVAMCRAQRSIEPLDRVAVELTRLASGVVAVA